MSRGTILDGESFQARRDAQEILAEARAEAERLRARLDEERAAARAEGLAEGRAEGRARAAADLACAARSLDGLLRAAEEDLRRVAVRATERILGRALALDPTLVREICAAALLEVRRARRVTLRLHPDDLPLVREELPALQALLEEAPALALVPDPGLTRGGCVVASDAGGVDARLETQLGSLLAALAPEPR